MRTAVDQRGEQTLNRNAEISEGVKIFAGNTDAITKWTPNRYAQNEILNKLKSCSDARDYRHNYGSLSPNKTVKVATIHPNRSHIEKRFPEPIL